MKTISSFLLLGLLAINVTAGAKTLNYSMENKAINERTAPFAAVDIEGVDPNAKKEVQVATGPEATYNTYCTTCHANGIAGAPVLGNQKAWAARVAQGKETLYKHAIKGYKAMPAKGTCMDCSEEDIQKTVDWMLKKL